MGISFRLVAKLLGSWSHPAYKEHRRKTLRERDKMPTTPPVKGTYGANTPGPRRPSPKAPRRDPWIKWLIAPIAVMTPFILAIINATPERPDRPPQGTGQSPAGIVGPTPPQNGERWDLIAVTAPADSELKRILNVPSLSDLPEHIRANYITVETKLR